MLIFSDVIFPTFCGASESLLHMLIAFSTYLHTYLLTYTNWEELYENAPTAVNNGYCNLHNKQWLQWKPGRWLLPIPKTLCVLKSARPLLYSDNGCLYQMIAQASYQFTVSTNSQMRLLKSEKNYNKINHYLTDWNSTTLSALTGYTVPLKTMLQLKMKLMKNCKMLTL